MRTEGLHVDFAQNVNFSPCANIAWLRVSKYQDLDFDHQNFFRLRIDSLPVNFSKNVNLSPWSRDCKFLGFLDLKISELKNEQENSSGLTI